MPRDTIAEVRVGATSGGSVALPDHDFIAAARMTHEGADLRLTLPDGRSVVVEGYFTQDLPPDLVAADGSRLSPHLVDSFLLPTHPGEYAAAGNSANDASPAGRVTNVSGEAHIIRADGVKVPVTIGMALHQGDVIETAQTGAVNLMFADNTAFAVGEGARMSVDKFIYDAEQHSGASLFALLQGAFVYTSGLIGKADPGNVSIETPVGTIGIRGTAAVGSVTHCTIKEGDIKGCHSTVGVWDGAIAVNNHGQDILLNRRFMAVDFDAHNKPGPVDFMNPEEFVAAHKTMFSLIDVMWLKPLIDLYDPAHPGGPPPPHDLPPPPTQDGMLNLHQFSDALAQNSSSASLGFAALMPGGSNALAPGGGVMPQGSDALAPGGDAQFQSMWSSGASQLFADGAYNLFGGGGGLPLPPLLLPPGAGPAPVPLMAFAGSVSPPPPPPPPPPSLAALSIDGHGYFQLLRTDGTAAYTRDGSFVVDANGQIVNAAGDVLISNGSAITIPIGSTSVTVSAFGEVLAVLSGQLIPSTVAFIQTNLFHDYLELGNSGGGIYTETAGSGAPVPGSPGDVGFGILEPFDPGASNIGGVYLPPVSLSGPGYFQVLLSDGVTVAYTQDSSSFQLNALGQVVDGHGNLVLGSFSPITVPIYGGDVLFDTMGQVYVEVPGTVEYAGIFDLAIFANPGGLLDTGGGLYTETVASGPPLTGFAGSTQFGLITEASNIGGSEFLSVNITGHGYFAIALSGETAYTRDGSLQLNPDGWIVTAQGYQVLGSNSNPIQIPAGTTDLSINSTGQVIGTLAGDINPSVVGQIGLTAFYNYQDLTPLSNNLYAGNALTGGGFGYPGDPGFGTLEQVAPAYANPDGIGSPGITFPALTIGDNTGGSPGYFQFAAGPDIGYTQDGSFKLEGSNGYLTTAQGHLLFPLIAIPIASDNVLVDGSGQVWSESGGVFTNLGQIQLSTFSNSAIFTSIGGDDYLVSEPPTATSPPGSTVGLIQESLNVDGTDTTDFSISGPGYFQVTLPDGTFAYTRDGSFELDQSGNIVTHQGYLLGNGSPITIPPGGSAPVIDGSGNILVDFGGGYTPVGQVQLSIFVDPSALLPLGNNIYAETPASGLAVSGPPGGTVWGLIEEAVNVNGFDFPDVNVIGHGYFAITLPSGETAYTRDGSFELNSSGQIVTHQGYLLQPWGTTIASDTTDIAISSNGEIWGTLAGDVVPSFLGQIPLFIFPNYSGLEALSNNLYIATADSGAGMGAQPSSLGYGELLQVAPTDVNPDGVGLPGVDFPGLQIDGAGYFQLMTGGGDIYYTVDGTFGLDSMGRVVNPLGYQLLSSGGSITIPIFGDDGVAVDSSGVVSSELGGVFFPVGQIDLAIFADPAALLDNGDGTYAATVASGPAMSGTPGTPGYGTVTLVIDGGP